MSKDKSEEKAREYAIKKYGDELIFHEPYLETLGDFKAGYTQAEQGLSTQLSACKEAFREIIKECEEWVVPGAENSNNCENNHCVEVDDLKSLITKAKTIIE